MNPYKFAYNGFRILLCFQAMERQRRIRCRTQQCSNYRDVVNYKLPRQQRVKRKKSQELFSVKVIEEKDSRVKVHYIGYSDHFDEWKERDEIEVLDPVSDPVVEPKKETVRYTPLSSFDELRLKIKSGLSCSRKAPRIKIAMPFDILLFNGSLKLAGTPSRKVGGTQYYKLSNYHELNDFLGPNWHYRGLNVNGDYGYVLKETFEFYIRKRRQFVEYMPSSDSVPTCATTDTGYSLSVNFTCGHGNAKTFGKDKTIFV